MAVEIPTINELYNDILNDYASLLQVDVSELGKSYQVRAKVAAGLQYQMYTLMARVQRNQYADLSEQSELIREGRQILGRTPAPATQGEYTIQVTGDIGAVIPASTQFKANDTTDAAGFLFIVDNEFTLTSETDTLTLRALTAGLDSLLSVGDLLTSTAPLINVENEAEVTAVATQPTAAEDIENYRDDVLEARRLEAEGGAASDYRLWASDVPEVRTVYPYSKIGSPGDVEVFIEATQENSDPLGIVGEPTSDTINAVYTPPIGANPESGALIYDQVDERGRKPVGVFNIFPLPVQPVAVDVKLTALTDESIASQLRTIIEALFYEIRPFIAGADNIQDRNDTLNVSAVIAETITFLSGTGITYTSLSLVVAEIETNSYNFDRGQYPYLRDIYNDDVVIS